VRLVCTGDYQTFGHGSREKLLTCLTLLVAGGAIVTSSPPAQVYNYPNCLQGRTVGIPDECSYQTYERCMASASGRALYCNVNPRAAFNQQRRQRQRYKIQPATKRPSPLTRRRWSRFSPPRALGAKRARPQRPAFKSPVISLARSTEVRSSNGNCSRAYLVKRGAGRARRAGRNSVETCRAI
jgi:hypothetical protein